MFLNYEYFVNLPFLKKMIQLKDKSFELFITQEEIEYAIEGMTKKIADDFVEETLVFVGVLNGAFRVFAEIIKNYPHNCETSFVKVNSYVGTQSSGEIKTVLGLDGSLKNRTVVLVEDIVDTGNTVAFLKEELKKIGVKKCKIATLFFKPAALQKEIKIDYVGVRIPNKFIVGYGLDYDGLGRNLNHIYYYNENN